MHILVDRYKSTPADTTKGATLSRIFVDGELECVGLEDEYRDVKVAGETRIPAGTYQVKLKTWGDFHSRYTKKFGDKHHGMLHVQDVPGFTDILIHIGNYETNTAGCLLVGSSADEAAMTIGASKVAYEKFYAKVWEAARDGNLTIEYVDNDR